MSCTVRAIGPSTESGYQALYAGQDAAVGDRHHAAGQRHGGAPAAAATGLARIVGIASRAENGVEGLRAGAELRGIGLAQRDGTGGFEPLDNEGIGFGDEVAEQGRPERRADTLGED
jgi:hypothetical protein